ncbi:MAG: hypothetical protein QM725_07205 [Lacibacter sp.]|jgi:hypothetical protein|nr:hypothetical protein [Ferruginibacter sp.]HMP20285.1 hypothetical protein [Ferruginibacter sp.]
MLDELRNKLLEYIRDNNPDVLFQLEQEAGLTQYLNQKLNDVADLIERMKKERQPGYLIETICLDQMTNELRPSKYNYICNILSEEFEKEFSQMVNAGLLQYEVINIVTYCLPIFEDLRFSEETADNRFTRYAIAGMISEYLESNSVKEKVSNGLQQSAKTQGQY